MSATVVDASALLALLNQEAGTAQWAPAIPGASISAVNLSEVVAKLTDLGMNEGEIRAALDALAMEVVPFDLVQAYLAGTLRQDTRALGLSLGDRACLALGRLRAARVLTADKVWTNLKLGLEVQVVREPAVG